MIIFITLSVLAAACIFICVFFGLRIAMQFHNDEIVFQSAFVFAIALTGLWSLSVAMVGLWV